MNIKFLLGGKPDHYTKRDGGKDTKKLFRDLIEMYHPAGADTDESNSADLIGRIQPSYAVLSAGNHSGDQHPKYSVVHRLLNGGILTTAAPFHKVRIHKAEDFASLFALIAAQHSMAPNEPTFKIYGHEPSEYVWASTSLGLYGTHGHNQGTINFSWTIDQPIKITYYLSKPLMTTDIHSSLTTLTTAPPNDSLVLSALDLSGLDLTTPQFSQIVQKIFSLPNTKASLGVINISNNQITDIVDSDLDLLENFPLIRLNLSSNPILDGRKEVIKLRFRAKLEGLTI